MPSGYPESAICVQRFDDSLDSAIHTTYRNWLCSSSMHEPRDPPLEIVTFLFCFFVKRNSTTWNNEFVNKIKCDTHGANDQSLLKAVICYPAGLVKFAVVLSKDKR